MQLKLKNLTFAYNKKEEKIVENFNLEVAKGEIAALVGASGSGKSTVLRLTAGLEIPDSGAIVIAGQTVADDHKFKAAEKREVGMVFQDYALFPHLNVYENILYSKKDDDLDKDKIDKHIWIKKYKEILKRDLDDARLYLDEAKSIANQSSGPREYIIALENDIELIKRKMNINVKIHVFIYIITYQNFYLLNVKLKMI
mgnify:CR=1 FL=1